MGRLSRSTFCLAIARCGSCLAALSLLGNAGWAEPQPPAQAAEKRLSWLENQDYVEFQGGNDALAPPLSDKYLTNDMTFGVSPLLERALGWLTPEVAGKLDARLRSWMITPIDPGGPAPWYGPVLLELSSAWRVHLAERLAVDLRPAAAIGPDLPRATGRLQNWFHDHVVSGADFLWPETPLGPAIVAYADASATGRWRPLDRVALEPFVAARVGTHEDRVSVGTRLLLRPHRRFTLSALAALDALHTRFYGPTADKARMSRTRIGGGLEARVARAVGLSFDIVQQRTAIPGLFRPDLQVIGRFSVKVAIDR